MSEDVRELTPEAKLVTELFANGFGDEAARLVLTSEAGRDLGGWSRGPVLDRVRAAFAPLRARVAELEEDVSEYEELFALQSTRLKTANDAWRAAHPGNEMVVQDLGALLEWLLGRIAALETKALNSEALMIGARNERDWYAENWRDCGKKLLALEELVLAVPAKNPDTGRWFDGDGEGRQEWLRELLDRLAAVQQEIRERRAKA